MGSGPNFHFFVLPTHGGGGDFALVRGAPADPHTNYLADGSNLDADPHTNQTNDDGREFKFGRSNY